MFDKQLLLILTMSDFKDDRFFLEISDQEGRPIRLPDSERKVNRQPYNYNKLILSDILESI